MTMLVSLMNLGESQRIFHNRLGRPVAVPVGKIVQVDLPGKIVQDLRFSTTPETIFVGDETMTEVPAEVRGFLDLLHVIEFDSYEKLVEEFLRVVPPNNLTQIRPSRQQMRIMLRTMVEDWIVGQREGKKVIHDDVDPRVLEREADRNPPQPVHPIKKEKDAIAALNGVQASHLIEQPAAEPPARPRKTKKARA